ncbi:MAG: hypothetical protein PHR30_04460 [Gallionellaceae bacterium]|nr:hypothetical protein [Gallionellaceae bacterium]MDD5364570.1 hypothetical protein [Gallionellaceae bacterium]
MPIKSFLARRRARRGDLRHKAKTHIASRVVIKKPVSWQRRLLWGGLIAVVAVLAGAGLFVAGQYTAGYDSLSTGRRMATLEQANSGLRTQNEELSTTLKTTTTQLHIEQGARQSMASQIVKLEDERSRLNRDLALFDNLFPSSDSDGQPSIRGFRIEPASAAGNPGSWRYRILIMRPGKARDSFVGDAQLQVRYRLDGHDIVARTPETGNISEHLEFQRYQRVEGHFQAPAGAKLLGATARVMDNGRLVAESIYRP